MTTSNGTAQNSIELDNQAGHESGYRIEANGKTIERFPFTPTGLRQASDRVKALSSGEEYLSIEEWDLFYGKPLSVLEYHESKKLLFMLPYQKYQDSSLVYITGSETIPQPPYSGVWCFWDVILKSKSMNTNAISENDLILVTQTIEDNVREQITGPLINDLVSSITPLTDPKKTLVNLGLLCNNHKKDNLSAVTLSNCIGLTSEDSYDLVAALTKSFRNERQRIIDNVLSKKTITEQIPESSHDCFAGDLRVFVSDEMIKAMALRLLSNHQQQVQMKQLTH